MTNEDKLREIFPKTIFVQHKESDKFTALVCSDEWLNAEYQEPTPKNNLGVDAVLRADARSLICKIDIKHHLSGMSRKAFKDLYNGIDELPQATPQEPRWIPVSERLPKPNAKDGLTARYYLIRNEYEDMLVARYDGMGWKQMYQHEYLEDDVIAWMPLPKAY